MGVTQSAFSVQELEDYQTLTYLSKKEILHVFKRFSSLDQRVVKHDKNAKLPFILILELPELKVNPFKDQIMKVFSSSGDGMTFEDFLDMMSVFSDKAPKPVKVEYAFRIYDFDGDDVISSSDLKEVILRLTGEGNNLTEEQLQQLIDNILEEADLDNDDALSFAEFEHVISKAPDFVKNKKIDEMLKGLHHLQAQYDLTSSLNKNMGEMLKGLHHLQAQYDLTSSLNKNMGEMLKGLHNLQAQYDLTSSLNKNMGEMLTLSSDALE